LRDAVVEDLPSLLALFDSQESVGLSKEQEKPNPFVVLVVVLGVNVLSVVFSVHHCNFITAKVGAKKSGKNNNAKFNKKSSTQNSLYRYQTQAQVHR